MLEFIGYWLSTLVLGLALLAIIVIWGFIIRSVIAEIVGFFKEKDIEEESGYWSEVDQ